MRSARGFTLIELMVAISIVAILATVGAVLFGNAQKTARDGKRRADIDAIAQVMENKFATCQPGYYCNISISDFAGGAIPKDPLNSPSGCGTSSSGGSTPCQYCFLSPSAPAYNSGWDAAHGGCGGIQPPAQTVDGGYWYNTPQQDSPGGANNYISRFLICANLESKFQDHSYYCRSNQQGG